VTDANLLLGLLSDESEFAGGSFRLTRKGVDDAFREHVAAPMGYSVEEAAFDCWRVVNANMTQAVRRTTAERGTDPRDLTLLAYGGNGPVFAGIQAQELGIARVLVPKASPGFSALGALAARPSIDEEHSYLVAAGKADVARLRAFWEELDVRAERFLLSAGFARGEMRVRYQLNLRYPGQNWSLTVEAAEVQGTRDLGFVTEALRDRVVERFHVLHEAEYGHRRATEEPEVTGVRLVASVEVPTPPFVGGLSAPEREAQATKHRRANLGRGFRVTPVYLGSDLDPGHTIAGPAIIEETFTTIVVYPGWHARLDDAGDYVLKQASSSSSEGR
jgi:N-methylhydantoinase A